jgi:hypothetical protein
MTAVDLAERERTGARPGARPGGTDQGLGHRRRPGADRALRAAARHLRRLDRLGPGPGLRRGRHPRPVLPWYANTHTESSGTGHHTTRLREQARQVIHQAVGGTAQDLVIFCGSGATAAVAKLVRLLELDGLAGCWSVPSRPPPTSPAS